MVDAQTLLDEARTLGLFRPQAPFEVHCPNCHARLDGRGDCATVSYTHLTLPTICSV